MATERTVSARRPFGIERGYQPSAALPDPKPPRGGSGVPALRPYGSTTVAEADEQTVTQRSKQGD